MRKLTHPEVIDFTKSTERCLSLNEAIRIIDSHPINILVKKRTGEESGVSFTFDTIKTEKDFLIFGQENGTDGIFLPMANIFDIYYEDEKIVDFSLLDGGDWSIVLCGEGERASRLEEQFPEIEVDEVLDMLKQCDSIIAIHAQAYIRTEDSYDIIRITDTNDDLEWGGEREITLNLSHTDDYSSGCRIDLDEYHTKYYLEKKAIVDNGHVCTIHIGLNDTAFTSVALWLGVL